MQNEKNCTTYFCLIGPSKSSPGFISASGSLVSTVVSTKQTVICDIHTVVSNKLSFLENIIGIGALKRTGVENCMDKDESKYEAGYGKSKSISVDT